MSKQKEQQEINRVIRKIRNKYRPNRIILFGSRATGKSRENSDLDLAIIKQTKKSFHQRNTEVRMLVSDSSMPIDIFVFTPNEFNEKKSTNPFLEEIDLNGKVVYEKR